MIHSRIWFLLLIIGFAGGLSSCNSEASLIDATTELLVDDDRSYTISNVKGGNFIKSTSEAPNLGTQSNPVWVRFTVEPGAGERWLDIQSANIDTLNYYYLEGNRVVSEYQVGEAFPFDARPINAASFVFPIPESVTGGEIYLRIVSGKQVLLPMKIGSRDEITTDLNNRSVFFGVYAGIVLVMLLYNLFIWFSVRDRNYLYYVLFIAFVGLTQLTLNGYGNQYFWPNNQWLSLRSAHFTGVLSGVTTVIFAQSYLRIRQYSKYLNYVLMFYLGVYVLAAVLAVQGAYIASYNAINFCAAASLLLVFAAWRSWRRGYRQALFFLIAWSIFLIGVTIYVLRDVGVLPYNLMTQYALPIGSALEIVLLSFALADSINQLKREKEKEQEGKLNALRENERIITEQNTLLERKVEERTHELAKSNQELNTTLTTLRSAQAQLVDAEKMASLGQMTAGIAHELNNPINFVSSNISPLSRDIDEVMEVLEHYSKLESDDPEMPVKLERAKALAKQYDTDFLKVEIKQLLKGIGDGAQRTAEIVKGLRIFSRLDEDTLKKADVNECLRSTLVIIKSMVKTECKVYDDLSADLPEINCYPGKLNQVFLNILVNAIQATAATGKPYEDRRVDICTRFNNESVFVSIKDNGTGMPPHVKAKIFDPFFTTKEVGQGTGLGLSIVLGIINDHKGKIDVLTTQGEGTEFLLTLSRTL